MALTSDEKTALELIEEAEAALKVHANEPIWNTRAPRAAAQYLRAALMLLLIPCHPSAHAHANRVKKTQDDLLELLRHARDNDYPCAPVLCDLCKRIEEKLA